VKVSMWLLRYGKSRLQSLKNICDPKT
jgi:hypothetical protein